MSNDCIFRHRNALTASNMRVDSRSATGEEHTVVDWRGHDRRPSCRGAYDDAKTPLAPYAAQGFLQSSTSASWSALVNLDMAPAPRNGRRSLGGW